jgi:hypothetical protein
MTSAGRRPCDFSVCNSYSQRSPQVRAYSFPQYPLDLLQWHVVVSYPLDISMMCSLIRSLQPHIQSAGDPVLFVETGVCSLASLPVRSGGLHSTPHDIQPCAYAKASATRVRLASASGYEPAHKGLTPSGAPARWSASPVE